MKIHRILQASRKEKTDEGGERVHQIVLAFTDRQEYVTWDFFEDAQYSGGHYHTDFFDALEDFKKRVEGTFGTLDGLKFCARQIGQRHIVWECLGSC